MRFQRRYSRPSYRTIGIICDRLSVLTGFYTAQDYSTALRRIRCEDEQGNTLVFLTNNLKLDAATISELYRFRWQVERFFKWIKQHLRNKDFFGTSENVVKSQIWIAVSVYVLVAILEKPLNLTASLHQILQVLSLTLFERTPLHQLLTRIPPNENQPIDSIHLIWFD